MKEKRDREEAEYKRQREQEELEYRKKREEERKVEEEKDRKLRDERLKEIERQRQYEEEKRIKSTISKEELEKSLQAPEQVPPSDLIISGSPPKQSVSQTPNPSTASNVCNGCGQPIQGQGLQALDKKWHSACFVCTCCKKSLSGSFLHTEGKPYCVEDFNKLFAKACGGCAKQIQGPFIRALNREWHPTGCFICANCSGTLSGGFFEKNTKPFCKNCVSLV